MYSANNNLKITKFLLHETGTYNTQYRRPYETRMEAETINRFTERLNNGNRLSTSELGGLSNRFLSPVAIPEKDIQITNGWDTRRMRFMLEIEHQHAIGTKSKIVILGYSNYTGVSTSCNIDPEMEFFANTILKVKNSTMYDNTGARIENTVYDSSHVLVNDNWNSVYDNKTSHNHYMRPLDVYTAMSATQLLNLGGSLLDTRTMGTNNAVKSKRSYTSSSDYVSNIFNGYTKAVIDAPYGEPESSILEKARGYANESMTTDDAFLCAIMQIRGDSIFGNKFTYRDLMTLDPNVQNVTIAQLLSPTTMNVVHNIGQTEHWQGSNIETTTANILSQSIPAIMMEVGITKLIFKATNRDIGSVIRTVIIDADGFSNIDMSRQLASFVNRVETEILQDISFNNSIDFALEMNVDLLGETWVKLAINGGPFIDYVTPSFCDALLTPVITSNSDQVSRVAQDFQHLTEHIIENRSGGNNKPSSPYNTNFQHNPNFDNMPDSAYKQSYQPYSAPQTINNSSKYIPKI